MNCIPDVEYKERIRKFQKNIKEAGLDAALVHSNEADFANVRYFFCCSTGIELQYVWNEYR